MLNYCNADLALLAALLAQGHLPRLPQLALARVLDNCFPLGFHDLFLRLCVPPEYFVDEISVRGSIDFGERIRIWGGNDVVRGCGGRGSKAAVRVVKLSVTRIRRSRSCHVATTHERRIFVLLRRRRAKKIVSSIGY